jgi:peptide/nickel transport system permease protein
MTSTMSSPDTGLLAGAEPEPRTQWQLFRRRYVRHKAAMFGTLLLLIVMVACFGADWLAPYERNDQDLLRPIVGPGRDHLLGVDELGRDYFTEVLFAGQLSLQIGIAVAIISTIVGTAFGALAGYFGGLTDQVLMRLTDTFLIIPPIALLAVALKRFGGTNQLVIILILAFLAWMTIARVVRGQVLSLKEKEFVEAARAIGCSDMRVILRHIIPNLVGTIMVNITVVIATAIIAESTLSFLGYGVQPPKSSWGNMLSQARGYVDTDKVYLLIFPGLMILLVVLAVSFIGDGLRDAFDPQAKH